MRILMISPQFRPIVGGYERAAERLAAALVASGHAVTVIAERRDPAWPAVETTNGTMLQRLWCIYRPGFHIITSLLSLAAFLAFRGRRFDVWHVHQYGVHAATAIALGKLLGRPVVLKLTSSANQGLSSALAQGRLPRLMAYWHRRVDAVVALTREMAAEAQAFGIAASRIHLLGNGVCTETFYPRFEAERLQLKERLGIGPHPVVIFVGRLAEEKNVSGLLLAWAEAQPYLHSEWKLVLVGDGPLRTDLESIVQAHSLSASVIFAGQQANISEWLGAADIYVLSSHNEGLSNTLLEGLACGLPAISTNVSGSAELIRNTGSGIVVAIGDMMKLAAAVTELAGAAERRAQMGAAGRAVIESHYSIVHVAERHERLYLDLLAGVKKTGRIF